MGPLRSRRKALPRDRTDEHFRKVNRPPAIRPSSVQTRFTARARACTERAMSNPSAVEGDMPRANNKSNAAAIDSSSSSQQQQVCVCVFLPLQRPGASGPAESLGHFPTHKIMRSAKRRLLFETDDIIWREICLHPDHPNKKASLFVFLAWCFTSSSCLLYFRGSSSIFAHLVPTCQKIRASVSEGVKDFAEGKTCVLPSVGMAVMFRSASWREQREGRKGGVKPFWPLADEAWMWSRGTEKPSLIFFRDRLAFNPEPSGIQQYPTGAKSSDRDTEGEREMGLVQPRTIADA